MMMMNWDRQGSHLQTPQKARTDLKPLFSFLSFPVPTEGGATPEERQSDRTVLSVNFFYTDEFEWVTADPEGYVNTLVAYANVGYVNSQLDMELEIFCIQRLPFLSETENGAAMLE